MLRQLPSTVKKLMSLEAISILTLLAAVASFWWQSDKIKRLAIDFVQRRCAAEQLQLLDQTLVLSGLALVRNQLGNLVLKRHYQFEFTSTGEARHLGSITMYGLQAVNLHLDPYLLPDEPVDFH